MAEVGLLPIKKGSTVPEATILIVDDEKPFCYAVAEVIDQIGQHETLIANSVPEALELLEMRLPDLILLDLVMPNTNGLDLASMLRSKDAWARIPIVALSADTRPETKISALTAGANCFLPKPFTIDELRIIIQPFLLEKSCNRASDTEAA